MEVIEARPTGISSSGPKRAGPALVAWSVPLGIGIALAAAFMKFLFYYGVEREPILPADALKLTVLMSPVIAMFGILSGGVALLIVYLPLRNKPARTAIALSYSPALVVAVITAPWAGIASALWSMIALVGASIMVGFLLPDLPPVAKVEAVDADASIPV